MRMHTHTDIPSVTPIHTPKRQIMATTPRRPRPLAFDHPHPGVIPLDEENSIVILHGVLPAEEVAHYTEHADLVERPEGVAPFGHKKPRREVCLRSENDTHAYKYGGIAHRTVLYPEHTLRVIQKIYDAFLRVVPANPFTRLSLGVDIVYDATLKNGGSVAWHADDEDAYGLVLIYSVGQSRTFRVRRNTDGELHRVPTGNNTVIAMYGPTFQARYKHEVPKLRDGEPVHTRYSLNVRYKLPDAAPSSKKRAHDA